MKRLLLSLTILAFTASYTMLSLTDVINAMRSGDAREIAKYLDTTVEISIAEKSNSYSKGQAEAVLRDFFSAHQIKKFEVLHKSESSASQYCIGNLVTNTDTFRTTIYLKQKGDKQLIQELRFEK